MNYYESNKNTPAIIEDDDGLTCRDDETSSDIIKGDQVKFYHPHEWTAGGEDISPDREFFVGKILKAVQGWFPGQKRPQTRILGAKEKFPDVAALNEAEPRTNWREVSGQLKGPWENAYVVYLLDPITKEILTYVANTVGGMRAVWDLRSSTTMARQMHGPAVVPRVTLSDTFMPTKYGGRQRPDFKVKCFEQFGVQDLPQQITHTPVFTEAKPVEVEEQPQAEVKEAKPRRKAATPAGARRRGKPVTLSKEQRAELRAALAEDDEEELGEDEILFETGGEEE